MGGRATDSAEANSCVEGYTADVGVSKRRKNFWDAQIQQDDNGGLTENQARRVTIRVIAPLLGAVFNPCVGMSGLSKASYLTKMPFGIANMSNVSITMLFKDLKKSLFRVLGGDKPAVAANNHATFAHGNGSSRPFNFKLSAKAPQLVLSYIRLGPHRSIRDSYSLSTFEAKVHRPTNMDYRQPATLLAALY